MLFHRSEIFSTGDISFLTRGANDTLYIVTNALGSLTMTLDGVSVEEREREREREKEMEPQSSVSHRRGDRRSEWENGTKTV